MELAKLTSKGQTTIPKTLREALGLHAGDVLSFEAEGDHLVLRKLRDPGDQYLNAVAETLGEWASSEDEEAWRDL
ncbi:MAG: AbrB/MazE/SpoVT family DNA-binding domain-containing protein [Chromatiales bacterium]|nr:AbrB/MazE/SpoVT family DNA-binding domain-containing protein [Gammaproteobacteria bacterium]MCP5352322.1 AbrB/MazE/SpoVT family DNA-binding domain-containing protein [Chromatiales bacterium]